jgi:AcrR family transcriptional regulator
MSNSPGERSTRDRILIAAATILGENAYERLTVRGVAARAGVSVGSLRHFFPTQHALIDAVVAGLSGTELPDDPIHDTTRDASGRLASCLELMLDQLGRGELARASWRKTFEAYIVAAPPFSDNSMHAALEQLGRTRIEGWLRVLAAEGATSGDGIAERARFLATVLNGISIERALPGNDEAQRRFETTTILRAAKAALGEAEGSDSPRQR